MTRKTKEMTLTEKLAQTIVEEYHPTSFKEVTDIVKSIYAPILEQMLQGELDAHLGYQTGSHVEKASNNRRNGYSAKNIKTSQGQMEIKIPRDREGSFQPQVVPKKTRDISEIEDKILAMLYKRNVPAGYLRHC